VKISTNTRIIAFLVASFLSVSPSISSATPIGDLVADMKLAKKITFGSTVDLALPTCSRPKGIVLVCTFETISITIKSFKFLDLGGWPKDTPRYAIALKMVNHSKSKSGVEVDTLLRCKNTHTESTYYDPGLDPQRIGAGAIVSGTVYMSFPVEVTPKTCQMPTLWIEAARGVHLDAKEDIALAQKAKIAIAAYIPLTVASITPTQKK
jgi:hypothetical protein